MSFLEGIVPTGLKLKKQPKVEKILLEESERVITKIVTDIATEIEAKYP